MRRYKNLISSVPEKYWIIMHLGVNKRVHCFCDCLCKTLKSMHVCIIYTGFTNTYNFITDVLTSKPLQQMPCGHLAATYYIHADCQLIRLEAVMFLKLHNNYGLGQSSKVFPLNIILKICSTLCFQKTILFFLYN